MKVFLFLLLLVAASLAEPESAKAQPSGIMDNLLKQATQGGGIAKNRKEPETINGLPFGWWRNSSGLNITSDRGFQDMINLNRTGLASTDPVTGEDVDLSQTHLFIEFYMKSCPFCF